MFHPLLMSALLACTGAPVGEPVAAEPLPEAAPSSAGPERGGPTLPRETDLAGEPGLHGVVRFDASGTRKVWAWRGEDARSTEIRAATRVGSGVGSGDGSGDGRGAWETRTLVPPGGNPDRPALSSDGAHVAFVSGATGVASVYVVPFAGGEPVQLTNVGLRTGGGRPPGFVPPPHDDSLRFDGDLLRWSSHEGTHTVEWR